jgi:O-antigen/teichoic acid export membrane protein
MEAGKESLVLTTDYIIRASALTVFAVIGTSVTVLSLGYVAGAVGSLAVAFVLLRSMKIRLVRPAFFREYVKFVLPMALPLVVSTLPLVVDRIVIGMFHGEFEVGLYSAAVGITTSIFMLGTVVNSLMLSHVSRLIADNRTEEARSSVWAAQKYLAFIMLPATVFLIVFGNEAALVLFGKDFAGSGPIMSILAAGIFFNVLGGILSQVLISAGRTDLYGRSLIAYAVLTLALIFVIIPDRSLGIGGGEGAAVAVVGGIILYSVLLAYYLRRLGLFGVYPRVCIHSAAAAAVLVMLCLVRTYLEPTGLVPLILIAFGALFAYAAILAAVKELTKDDIRFVRRTFSFRNIRKDLKDEMRNK